MAKSVTTPACPRCGSISDWVSYEPTTRGDVYAHLDTDGWTRTAGPTGTKTADVLGIEITCEACGFDTASDEVLWRTLAENPASPRNR